MKEFLLNNYAFLTVLFELLAAVSGSLYLREKGKRIFRIFVYYLWLTVVIEALGGYPKLMQHNFDYEWFVFLKNSPFCSNTWLYNIYTLLSIGFIGVFYLNLLEKKINVFVIRLIIFLYTLFSVVYFTMTDAFFYHMLPYNDIIATVVIVIFAIFYLSELIRSEEILIYYKLPSFYITAGLLFWYLSVTPLFIFNEYHRAINEYFNQFRHLLLLSINILTYSCFAFGFLYPLYKRK
ncbi:MAG: hypothetical protein AAF688_03605 [Bacteroidota bacterium]